MTYYYYDVAEKLINTYLEKGGEVYTLPGSLVDNHILTGEKLKTCIIKEVYLNEWASAVKIKFYNKIPKKYVEVLKMLADDETEQAEKIFWR